MSCLNWIHSFVGKELLCGGYSAYDISVLGMFKMGLSSPTGNFEWALKSS